MLTNLLLLAALVPLQDAPATQDPAAPATETSPSVRAFLVEAESHLYDPQAAGLSSLEFDVPINHPQAGMLGTAHVSWSSAGQPSVTTSAIAGAPPLPKEQLDMFGMQFGYQTLGAMLNKPITPLLEGAVATMNGVEEGLVKVSIAHPQAEAAGVKEQSLMFDEDGLLKVMRRVSEVQGPLGMMTISEKQIFSWKAVAADNVLVVPASQKTESTMGSGETTFGYSTIAGIVLPTTLATVAQVPGMGEVNQSISAINLVVNGQVAPPSAPVAPAGG